jgi:hypothetical protein
MATGLKGERKIAITAMSSIQHLTSNYYLQDTELATKEAQQKVELLLTSSLTKLTSGFLQNSRHTSPGS